VPRICRSRCTATNAEKSINLLIDHQCPQCGAPATITETERLFSCDFCKVKSYLLSRDVFRYRLPHKCANDRELFYVPYWRYKGMLYSCIPEGIRHRFVDASHQACDSTLFPVSVGLRSQALKLQFVLPDNPGHFIAPTQPVAQVVSLFEKRFSATLKGPVFHQAHIGDAVSLIYAPFYLKKHLYDAVLDQPIAGGAPEGFVPGDMPGGAARSGFDFVPAICPHCGWDMEGHSDSLVLVCRNCTSMWFPAKGGLKAMKFGHVPAESGSTTFLPFWRISAHIDGLELSSYADVVRMANLPRVPQPEWDEMPFRFWVPAFKIAPQVYRRLGSAFTLSQPRDNLSSTIPEGDLYPVTLPFSEGIEALKVTLAGFMKPRRDLFPRLPQITVRPRGVLLVYVPFTRGHHDLTHPTLGIAVNRRQLGHAGNL
jgi:hypothetical protein